MTRRIEIETADQFIAEVHAAPGETDAALFLRANITANRLAREFRRPSGDFKLRVPADLRLPVAGGGTRTAADMGLLLLP